MKSLDIEGPGRKRSTFQAPRLKTRLEDTEGRAKRRLLRMLPSKLPCTTLTRPFRRAKADRSISTALPKEAFSRPPSVSPTLSASSSVAIPGMEPWDAKATRNRPKILAIGRMARKFKAKFAYEMRARRPSEGVAFWTPSPEPVKGMQVVGHGLRRRKGCESDVEPKHKWLVDDSRWSISASIMNTGGCETMGST